VLEELLGGPLDWTRLAITARQVEAYDLPVISKPDNRFKPVRYHDAVETEALGQSIIVGIVRDHLNDLLTEPLNDVLAHENRQRTRVTELLRKLRR
jgi:hypothetical protein